MSSLSLTPPTHCCWTNMQTTSLHTAPRRMTMWVNAISWALWMSVVCTWHLWSSIYLLLCSLGLGLFVIREKHQLIPQHTVKSGLKCASYFVATVWRCPFSVLACEWAVQLTGSALLFVHACVCLGVHAVRVPEDERYLLGADSHGPDGAAAPDEPAGDHRLHQSLPAWVWRHQRQYWTRPPPALHPQRSPGDS